MKKPTVLPRWVLFSNLELACASARSEVVGQTHSNALAAGSSCGVAVSVDGVQLGALAQAVVVTQFVGVHFGGAVLGVAGEQSVGTHGHVGLDNGTLTSSGVGVHITQGCRSNAEVVGGVGTDRAGLHTSSRGHVGASQVSRQRTVGVNQAKFVVLGCFGGSVGGIGSKLRRQLNLETAEHGAAVLDLVVGTRTHAVEAQANGQSGIRVGRRHGADGAVEAHGVLAAHTHFTKGGAAQASPGLTLELLVGCRVLVVGTVVQVETRLQREVSLQTATEVFSATEAEAAARAIRLVNQSGLAAVGRLETDVGLAVHGDGRLSERSGGSQSSQSNNERLFTEIAARVLRRCQIISASFCVNLVWFSTYNFLLSPQPFFANGFHGIHAGNFS